MPEIIEAFTMPNTVVNVVTGILSTIIFLVIARLFTQPVNHLESISIRWYKGKISTQRRNNLLFVSDLSTDTSLVQLMTTKINSVYLQSTVLFIAAIFSVELLDLTTTIVIEQQPNDPLTLEKINPTLIIPVTLIISCLVNITEGSKIFKMIDQSIYLRKQREENIEGFYTDEKLKSATDEEIRKLYILLNGTIWQRILGR